MSHLNELHHFSKFSISSANSGDIYAELDTGQTVLLISSSGSDEHERECEWHRSPDRVEEDYDYTELCRMADEQDAEDEIGTVYEINC